jgi:hypothetical protein
MKSDLAKQLLIVLLVVGTPLVGANTTSAEDAPPLTRIRGTIASFDGSKLEVKTRGGEVVTAALASDVSISAVVIAKISDIKPNSFIGVTAVPVPEGGLKALEVHVFPESMRGAGEGHRPWDLRPKSSMTNGVVGRVTGTSVRTVTVKYGNDEKQILIPDDVPVVSMDWSDKNAIKVGVAVVAFVEKAPGGSLAVKHMIVGKDGAVPGM